MQQCQLPLVPGSSSSELRRGEGRQRCAVSYITGRSAAPLSCVYPERLSSLKTSESGDLPFLVGNEITA